MPFYLGIGGNIKAALFHGGICKEYELKQPYELKEE
jgi:hypothetical protein